MSWAAHELENYVIQRHGGLRISFLAVALGAFSPDMLTKGFVYGLAVGPASVIGSVLKEYPSTERVFRKYYGAACFSCPGQATETIRQSAMMHNANESELLRELNEAVGAG